MAKALLPFAFTTVGRHYMIKLVDPERIDWRHGFLGLGLASERPIESVDAFEAWVSRPLPEDFSGLGAIFHVSRCGSTLLAQNLKATGKAIVLSEPVFLRILRGRLHDSISPELSIRAVARAFADWLDWARAQGKVLVVKLNSQVHVLREELIAALPGARFMFLHREPAPVLESIMRNPPPYLQRESGQKRFSVPQALESIGEDPLLLAGASRYVAALDAFEGAGADGILRLAYGELAADFETICSHFGMAPDAGASWQSLLNAKSFDPGNAKPYRAVGDDRLAEFTQAHKDVVAFAEQRYKAFLAAAAQSGNANERSGGQAPCTARL